MSGAGGLAPGPAPWPAWTEELNQEGNAGRSLPRGTRAWQATALVGDGTNTGGLMLHRSNQSYPTTRCRVRRRRCRLPAGAH